MNFSDFKLSTQFLNAIEELGYQQPTPIQSQVIPMVKAGKDVIGIAPTGTGKTLAYVLPTLIKLGYAQEDAPRVLILAPTKELILQISEVIAQVGKYTNLRQIALIGGVGKTEQLNAVLEGVDIIIATPRRFMEIYHLGTFKIRKINTLILDEADKMLDMGFLPQINKILDIVPMKKQNLLFSASFSEKVELLSKEFILIAEKVEIQPQATTADLIEQFKYDVPNILTKINLLIHLLKDESLSKVIVFVRTKQDAGHIFKSLLGKVKGTVSVIHSNKEQNTRINTIKAFKRGEVRVLIATDVISRGIDIETVSHVVNFDVPTRHEDYVHRVGRTGRADKEGIAYTFVNEAEKWHFKKIEQLIQKYITTVSLPEEVAVTFTPKDEKISMLRRIDNIKKKENPDYQGAFHEKKWK